MLVEALILSSQVWPETSLTSGIEKEITDNKVPIMEILMQWIMVYMSACESNI